MFVLSLWVLGADCSLIVRVAKAEHADDLIKTVAICAGSGSSVLNPVDADLFFTGEMGHHDVLAALAKNTSVILCKFWMLDYFSLFSRYFDNISQRRAFEHGAWVLIGCAATQTPIYAGQRTKRGRRCNRSSRQQSR